MLSTAVDRWLHGPKDIVNAFIPSYQQRHVPIIVQILCHLVAAATPSAALLAAAVAPPSGARAALVLVAERKIRKCFSYKIIKIVTSNGYHTCDGRDHLNLINRPHMVTIL